MAEDRCNIATQYHPTLSFMETLQDCPAHIPVGAVPLLATDHHGYAEKLAIVTATANNVYSKFLHSKEGDGFTGQVSQL